jgi:hypothetical protein
MGLDLHRNYPRRLILSSVPTRGPFRVAVCVRTQRVRAWSGIVAVLADRWRQFDLPGIQPGTYALEAE